MKRLTKDQTINLLASAMYASTYWAGDIVLEKRDPNAECIEEQMLNGFKITDMEDLEAKQYTVTKEAIVRAGELLHVKHPKHYADVLEENDDGATGDIFLQLCVFGEVIYG